MPSPTEYAAEQPLREQIDALPGAAVVEFGTNWCGICKAAQPMIREAFEAAPEVTHLKVEDGSGRPLGRSFGIRLWPTLVFLRDGREVARVVRPQSAEVVQEGLGRIA